MLLLHWRNSAHQLVAASGLVQRFVAAAVIIVDVRLVQVRPIRIGAGFANTACDWHRGATRIRRRHTRVQALIERPVEVVAVIIRATALGLRDEYEIYNGVRTRKLASGNHLRVLNTITLHVYYSCVRRIAATGRTG